jgi:hypothetical protein
VIDAFGLVRYEEIVPEITTEPDYATAMAVLTMLLPEKSVRRQAGGARKRQTATRKRPAVRADKTAETGRRRR